MGSFGPLIALVAAGGFAAGLVLLVPAFSEPPPKDETPEWLRAEVSGTILLWAMVSAIIGVLTWFASGWPAVGAGAAALVWVGKFWFRASRERKIYFRTTEAISTWIDMVKDSLSGGAGLSQAIESTVTVAPEIVRPHVLRLASSQRTMSQSWALREFGAALAHPTSDLVVQALITASEHQARDLPRLLAKTSEQARARNAAVLQAESERAKLYTEARAMVVAVIVLGTIIAIVAHDFFKPYDNLLGQMILGFIMVLMVGSAAALVQAGRPQRELRLLALPPDPGQEGGLR